LKKIYSLTLVVIFTALCIFLQLSPISACAGDTTAFSGNGTQSSPYLIQTAEDLKLLRDNVNNGENYEGKYFRQTENIDLKSEEWIPIGVYSGKSYFYGIYDGTGHYIENLVTGSKGNNGLFGKLGGVVMNLGIENGEIHGDCIGAFTSHAAGSKAVIINCYNKAAVYGSRGGGIADNFNGIILNCWTDCELLGRKNGDIYGFKCVKAINCFTNNGGKNEVDAQSLNKGILVSASKAEVDCNILNTWTSDGERTVFSEDKYQFKFSDFPEWLKAYGTWIILGSIAAACFIILLYEFIRKKEIVSESE